MFLSTRGAVQYGKPIALKCIYLFCRRSSATEQVWGEELEIRKLESTQRQRKRQFFQRVEFCPSMPCTESCGVVCVGEDTSSICLHNVPDHNTTLATDQRRDVFLFMVQYTIRKQLQNLYMCVISKPMP